MTDLFSSHLDVVIWFGSGLLSFIVGLIRNIVCYFNKTLKDITIGGVIFGHFFMLLISCIYGPFIFVAMVIGLIRDLSGLND